MVEEEEEEEEEEEGWEGKEAAPQSALADGFFEEGGKMAFKMRPNTLFHVHISTSVRCGRRRMRRRMAWEGLLEEAGETPSYKAPWAER